MAANRTADDIQRDIEQARVSLATAVDQLAERTSPKRIMNETKQNLIAKAQTPAGKAVIGGGGNGLLTARLPLVSLTWRFG